MKILALETSAKAVSAAVRVDGKLLCVSYQNTGLTHSQTLMPMVAQMLKNTGQSVGDMDAVAVAVGPGSFTGLRIGIAAAKGLAFGAEKPVIGVSTLAAMARNISFADGLIVCAMDARRAQIYNALFRARDGELERLTADRAISLADLRMELHNHPEWSNGADIHLVGDGAELCAVFFRENGVECRTAPAHLLHQNAASVAWEAEEHAAIGELLSPHDLQPFYLRPPQAVPPAGYHGP